MCLNCNDQVQKVMMVTHVFAQFVFHNFKQTPRVCYIYLRTGIGSPRLDRRLRVFHSSALAPCDFSFHNFVEDSNKH